MYDLSEDPDEMRNLFDDPAGRAMRKELEDMIRARPGPERKSFDEPTGMA